MEPPVSLSRDQRDPLCLPRKGLERGRARSGWPVPRGRVRVAGGGDRGRPLRSLPDGGAHQVHARPVRGFRGLWDRGRRGHPSAAPQRGGLRSVCHELCGPEGPADRRATKAGGHRAGEVASAGRDTSGTVLPRCPAPERDAVHCLRKRRHQPARISPGVPDSVHGGHSLYRRREVRSGTLFTVSGCLCDGRHLEARRSGLDRGRPLHRVWCLHAGLPPRSSPPADVSARPDRGGGHGGPVTAGPTFRIPGDRLRLRRHGFGGRPPFRRGPSCPPIRV